MLARCRNPRPSPWQLRGSTAVAFGSTSAGFTVVSDTKITCLAPPGTGTVQVTVTSPNGTSSQDVTYSYDQPATLSASLSQAQATVSLSAG